MTLSDEHVPRMNPSNEDAAAFLARHPGIETRIYREVIKEHGVDGVQRSQAMRIARERIMDLVTEELGRGDAP